MDLYCYFHPHHNPHLRNTALRHQELGELEQAAEELRRATARAKLRTETAPVGGIQSEHFAEILVALDYVVDSFRTLTTAHPGDDPEVIFQIVEERKNVPGWEDWARLVSQKFSAFLPKVKNAA